MIFQALVPHGALLRAPRAMNHPVCKVEVQGFLPIELPPLPSGQTLKLVQEAEGGGSSAAEIADASGVWSAEDAHTWRRIAEYVEDELADTLSVGGRLWPSAAALCRWMRGEASLRGARVLELGCGTGACGLYAAHCGAAEVLLTDGSETLQPLIDANVASNPAPGCAVRSQRYLWGEPLPAGRFDLAIASDCSYFYEEEAHAALAATCAALLDAGTRIVCAHEHRSRGPKFWADDGARWDATDEYLARFAAAAANRGLALRPLASERPRRVERGSFAHYTADCSVFEVFPT